jgi:hypothetical protein
VITKVIVCKYIATAHAVKFPQKVFISKKEKSCDVGSYFADVVEFTSETL